MSNIAKLKKQAAEFEQKKQFDRALAKYIQIIQELDGAVDEADVALYNRVGDLLLKQGNISQAVDYYERAVDLYTEGGFFNNAIALCNKILRNAPGRNSVYYKLGKISAQKGFVNDAKQNFLEYADRMQNAGQLEEAFRALKEFADLCPDQDDIRLMLADQLVRKNRKGEAIEQLQTLYEKFQSEGRTREARATVDRIKAIDPDVEPRATTSAPTPKATDLIFLHVDYDAPPSNARGMRTSVPIFPPVDDDDDPRASRKRRFPADLPLIMPDFPDEEPAPAAPGTPATPAAAAPPVGLEHTALTEGTAAESEIAPVDGLESVGGAMADIDLGDLGTDSGLELGDLPSLDVSDDLDAPDESPVVDLSLAYPDSTGDEPSRIAEAEGEDFDESAALGVVLSEPELELPDAGLVVPDLPGMADTLGSEDEPTFDIAREQSQFLDPHETDEVLAADSTLTPSFDSSLDPSASSSFGAFGDDIEAALDAALEGGQEIEPFLPGRGGDSAIGTRAGAVARSEEPSAESPVVRMRRQLEVEPDNWPLRRSYAEALLEEGDRNDGLRELDSVMVGFERWSDFVGARAVAEEILRVDPNSVKHHQKRVEYAFRAGDKSGLVDAYLELADCLFRGGQLEKSRVVYQRVLELAPQDVRAQEALRAYGKSDRTPPSLELPKRGAPIPDRPRARQAEPTSTTSPTPPPGEEAGFVNLADLLRDDDSTRTTRMVVDVKEPGTGEQVDFAEMLHMFKQGVAANVEEGDHQSHYDLGVAYKEMGLLDEAISEFQKALRGTEQRVRTYEALGQCFVEKRQYQIAITILSRALNDKRYTDDMLVGVLYLLGTATEQLERWPDAVAFYQRVFAVDIEFRDVRARLSAVERRAR